jgi:hypothetical protein
LAFGANFISSRIRIHIRNADPDPGDKFNADPDTEYGSGSETLLLTKGMKIALKVRPALHQG